VHFTGGVAVTVPPGAEIVSDSIPLSVEPLSELAVSMWIHKTPSCLTSHQGSHATSFLAPGQLATEELLAGGESIEHWYFLSSVEVEGVSKGAVVAFGDSITDGHGSTTDGNDRWTDVLAARLAPQNVAVLNMGIGGNRILVDGIGPSGVSRFEHDALHQNEVRTVILLEGVNDIGILDRLKDHPQNDHDELVHRLELAMTRMAEQAHRQRVCLLAGTVTPYVDSDYYHPRQASEDDRKKLNTWIRTSGVFDGVIDFDKMLRNPAQPDHLDPEFDSGDHLHPGPDGYHRMGEGVPLSLIALPACSQLP